MKAMGSPDRRSTFVLLTLAVMVSALAASAFTLWRLRAEAVERHAAAAGTYAHSFEDHLTQAFKLIELALVNSLSVPGARTPDAAAFAAALRHAPYLRSLAQVDARGTVVASSASRDLGAHVERQDFLPRSNGPRYILRVAPPWAGRDFRDGRSATPERPLSPELQSLIPVLRDVELDSGSWTTLLAAVNPDYFLSHYESSLPVADGVVELLRYDGMLLLSSDPARRPGSRIQDDTLSVRIGSAEAGQFEQQLGDGRQVLTAFRASANYPFVIVVHLDKERGLAGWRREATQALAVVVIALLAGLALAGLYFVGTAHAVRRHDAALAKLSLQGAALNAAANSIIITSQDGTVEWANPAFCTLSGYPLDEVLGRRVGDLLRSGRQAPERSRDLWGTILDGKVWRGELVNRRKDGTHYLEGQTITPVCDEAGAIRHFIAVKQDITARRQAETDLQESEARLQATLDAIPDMLFEVGLDGRFHEVHTRRDDLLAVPRQRLLGRRVAEVLPGTVAARVMAALEEANANGSSVGRQIALTVPEGRKWFELSIARKTMPPDEAPRFIVLSRDITERKQSENRVEELSRHIVAVQESARRRLSGELHDRTSPNLAAIAVNLDIMAAGLQDAPSAMLAERLADVRALIEDTAASIREICSDLRPPVLDYAGLAAALETHVRQFQRRTGIAVRIDCDRPAARLTAELETMLFRIVQEALTNCAKHSRARSVVVSLQLDRGPVRLTVSDDGSGFDPAALGKTRSGGGLGILTMKEMAELAGGRFVLDSAPGQGTRISVEIETMEGPT
jgi:PAS domain S-box-containing protein